MIKTKKEDLGFGIKLTSALYMLYTLIALTQYLVFFNSNIKFIRFNYFFANSSIDTLDIKLTLLSSVLSFGTILLILLKNEIGVYLFVLVSGLDIIANIVSGLDFTSLIISIILPCIMGFEIYKKKDLFFK